MIIVQEVSSIHIVRMVWVTVNVVSYSVIISSSIDQSSWLPSGRYLLIMIGIFLALKIIFVIYIELSKANWMIL